jgi:hypothetical protein
VEDGDRNLNRLSFIGFCHGKFAGVNKTNSKSEGNSSATGCRSHQ